ncbi:hypothetical protein DPMN_171186 [Dreissena polymorpha]|uniref:Uncharacterized protein n=1 Tax=Dreissena polymorpha TaxID=45954 RepID=A0A9D4E0N8_DREPO|nr:hypothetical protein DPMN_171186 [Dreissena polymorpha]
MSNASKRKHIGSSSSELDSSVQITPDKQNTRQKKKKGKRLNQEKDLVEIETESIMAEHQIKEELKAINEKLTNIFSGSDSSFKQIIVDIINQTKQEFLKSVEKKIEVLESKLFEKETENYKLKLKIEHIKQELKEKADQEKQTQKQTIELSETSFVQIHALEQYGRRNNIRIFGIREETHINNNGKIEAETSEITAQKVF